MTPQEVCERVEGMVVSRYINQYIGDEGRDALRAMLRVYYETATIEGRAPAKHGRGVKGAP